MSLVIKHFPHKLQARKSYFGLHVTFLARLFNDGPLLLPPANEVCEGYVFTHVCLSTGGEEYLGRYPRPGTPPGRYTPSGRYPPGRYTPGQVPPSQVHPQAGTPSWAGTPPLAGTSTQAGTPPRQVPPGQAHPPWEGTPWAGTPPGQVQPPAGTHSPWRGTPPPGTVHAGRYGQQAGGTHPTGMHSCLALRRW